MAKQKENYYRVLQVDAYAEPEVIEGAYRRLAMKYHPDLNDAASQTKMQLINEAYQVLRDPARRAQYDQEMAGTPKEVVHNDFGEMHAGSAGDSFNELPSGFPSDFETPLPAPVKADGLYRIARLVLNIAVTVLVVVLVGLAGWMAYDRLTGGKQAAGGSAVQVSPGSKVQLTLAPELQTEENAGLVSLPVAPFASAANTLEVGVKRLAMLHTTIPTRPRTNVISYTVVKGDNLFLIGEKFGIKPETVLFGNYEALNDNPRMLKVGQELKILPTDGVYHQWKEGDTLRKVAESYKAEAQAVLDYPGNKFDLTQSSIEEPGIEVGAWIIVPGGKRPIKDWGPPAISRTNPAVASYYGEGSCGKIMTGAVGNGTFVWPVPSNHTISGYDYTEIHKAIDIGGSEGAPIVAADSGVVVYSGWSIYGYGNLLVIDHGNGWQTAYAHLLAVGAGCGQSVMQGGTVATLGNTGNSSGPHLHFEMKFNGAPANPHDFLPQ